MRPVDSAAPGRREIESAQVERLRAMLTLLAEQNPFYSAKLLAAGAEIGSLEEFSRRVPFTCKQELIDDQQLNPPFGTNLTYSLDRYAHYSQTSATTGKPMIWLDTQESWEGMLDSWDRVFQAAGVTSADRIFFAFSFGPFLGFWTAFAAASRMGCLCMPGGGMRSSARLGVILGAGATVLCATPTYAVHLAEVAAAENIDLSASRVRSVIVAGEPGGSIPSARRQIERLWRGARVTDHHGMTEVGPVTYGCPSVPDLLHVIESAFHAEIVDPGTGEPVPPGGSGELVLTNLGRLGSPLLRYRTGDIVRRGEAGRCFCGSFEMALPGGILARTDDMVTVRGVNVYPAAVDEILRCTGGVAEYRVSVGEELSLVQLSIEVEPDAAHKDDDTLPGRLETALRDALALRIPVTSVPRGTLPRFEMKARRWQRS